jgi:hypothetical protein
LAIIIKHYFLLFILVFVISIYFRLKIVYELPLGNVSNEYWLSGFDDEPAHLNYIKYLLDNNKLPKLETKVIDPKAFETNEFEYHQPPLYYSIIYLLSKLFLVTDLNDILILGRLFNVLLSLIGLIILFRILKVLELPDVKILAALSIYLLIGSSVYQFTVFGNDALSWVFLWLLLLLILNGIIKKWFIIVIVITLSHYTKLSILPFYLLLFVALFLEIKKSGLSKTKIYKVLAIIFLPLIFSLPWYLRNYNEYGNFFLINFFDGEWHFVKTFDESILKLLRMPYSFLFRMQFAPPKIILSWFNLIPNLWLVASIVLWILRVKNIFKIGFNMQIINFLLIIIVGAYLYYAIPTGYTEGRFLYPALPAIIYFMTEVLFIEKIKNILFEGWQIAFVLLILLPSYIVGFYF